jgi:hypothetical protein
MNKSFILLLAAVALCVSFGLSSKVNADRNYSALINPAVTPKKNRAEIVSLELDRKEVNIPCPPNFPFPGASIIPECDYEKAIRTVAIKTIVSNPKNRPLTYQYTVSGGQIIGQGEKVVWDLKSVRPGKYTISAAIDEGRGFGNQSKVEEVEVVDRCCCLMPCVCPTLDVRDGGKIKSGENATFTVLLTGGSDTTGLIYEWTVSQGEIVEGQGTPKITVRTSAEMTGKIEARVKVTGPGLCETCVEMTAEGIVMFIK